MNVVIFSRLIIDGNNDHGLSLVFIGDFDTFSQENVLYYLFWSNICMNNHILWVDNRLSLE